MTKDKNVKRFDHPDVLRKFFDMINKSDLDESVKKEIYMMAESDAIELLDLVKFNKVAQFILEKLAQNIDYALNNQDKLSKELLAEALDQLAYIGIRKTGSFGDGLNSYETKL